MGWVRSNVRFGACLAFIALAFQIVLSFGHVHLNGVAPATANVVGSLDSQGSDAPAAPAIPKKSQHRTAGDFCAICSLIQLAGNVLPAATPPLPQPTVLGRALLGHGDQLALAASRRGLWHARAPPLA
jgi:hypothetical protein